MKAPLLTCVLCLLSAGLFAETACVTSPETAQTYSYGSIAYKKLIWDEDRNLLQAVITFSNVPYADRVHPKDEEFFAFSFPGVTFDKNSGTFYATGEKGGQVAVAEWKEGLISDWIEPGPNAQIFVIKRSGRVEVTIAGTTEKIHNPMGTRWVERTEGWGLGNLISQAVR